MPPPTLWPLHVATRYIEPCVQFSWFNGSSAPVETGDSRFGSQSMQVMYKPGLQELNESYCLTKLAYGSVNAGAQALNRPARCAIGAAMLITVLWEILDMSLVASHILRDDRQQS